MSFSTQLKKVRQERGYTQQEVADAVGITAESLTGCAEIGGRIKQRRTELNLTQGAVAAEVGVAVSTIQRYEAGTIERIKRPVIEAIARSLHVNPDWLLGLSSEAFPVSEPHQFAGQRSDVRAAFTESLHSLMHDRGVTTAELSRAIGVPYTTAAGWWQGCRFPRPEQLEALAKYFGVSTAEVIGSASPAEPVRPEISELLEIAESATKEEIEAVIQLFKTMKGGASA